MRRTLDREEAAKRPHLVWNAFIDLVATEDYAVLNPVQRQGHLLFWYESEVENGGHLQYFANRGTERVEETIAALASLGLSGHAELLRRVARIWASRPRGAIATAEDYVAEALNGELAAEDTEFHRCTPTIHAVLERHLAEHQIEYVELS